MSKIINVILIIALLACLLVGCGATTNKKVTAIYSDTGTELVYYDNGHTIIYIDGIKYDFYGCSLRQV